MEEGCLLWGYRVIVPKCLRGKLLQELHKDHPGVIRMKSVARSFMWWPGLDKDIEHLAKSCQSCQAVKRAPPVAPLHPWIWPSKPWQRVHLDFAGPFQGSMFLVGVDAYSKWPEVRVMSVTTASATLDVLREWFAIHGIPEQLVTDNGTQFTSEAFEIFVKRNGIKYVKSAPYHPASNGLAERFIQSLKQSLKASANDGRTLIQRLSSYLLSYRTTAHSTTGVSPCKLLMQRDLRTRFSLLLPNTEQSVMEKQSVQKSSHDRRSRLREFIVGDRVLVRNHRPGPDWIPGTIIEVLGPVTYTVEIEDGGQRWKRHIDQLKDWLAPTSSDSSRSHPETHSEQSEQFFPDSSDPPPNSEVAADVTEPAADPTDPAIEEPETPETDNTDPVTPPEEPAESGSETVERRYPTRNRQPPNYYH